MIRSRRSSCMLLICLILSTIVATQGNEISVLGSCFDQEERIPVEFLATDFDDLRRTWVGIYPVEKLTNLQDLPEGDMWVWLCGSQDCSPDRNPISGSIRFRRSSQGWEQDWPLRDGSYRAALITGFAGEPWRVIALSNTFEVGCGGGSPTPRPTPVPTIGSVQEGPIVSMERPCNDLGRGIGATFSGMLKPFTFIALFSLEDLDNGITPRGHDIVTWQWLCGSTSFCEEWPESGDLSFRPVDAGEYRAVAMEFESTGLVSVASSADFMVGDCSSFPDPTPRPTPRPTSSPITRPSPVPTVRPTPRPTPLPTPRPVAPMPEMRPVINRARRAIQNEITDNNLLVGKFLRLAFHDCVGGCDGCVDMANPDNAGLVMPINALQSVVQDFEDEGMSRTDIWMLAALVASEVSERTLGTDFPMQWIGRKTCEELNNNNCGRNAEGRPSTCGPFGGPHRALCHADTAGTGTIQDFMAKEFGFDAQKTTAIMGAHSVGAMRDVNLGFEGRAGWDLTNDRLDHGYFVELVGERGDPVDNAPNWRQVLHRNGNLRGIPDRWQYEVRVDGVDLTMLNSDVALVRNLVEGENLMENGRVTCNFQGQDQCDSNTPFMPFVIQYSDSRREFLRDYREALNLLIDNGYERNGECGRNAVCVLTES